MPAQSARERLVRRVWADHGSEWKGLGPLIIDLPLPMMPPDSLKFEIQASTVKGEMRAVMCRPIGASESLSARTMVLSVFEPRCPSLRLEGS